MKRGNDGDGWNSLNEQGLAFSEKSRRSKEAFAFLMFSFSNGYVMA
jgi:hypothetical protein